MISDPYVRSALLAPALPGRRVATRPIASAPPGRSVHHPHAGADNQRVDRATTLGGVDGFDEDEAESQGDDGAVVLGRLLTPQRHTLGPLQLTHKLLEAGAGAIKHLREELRPGAG